MSRHKETTNDFELGQPQD